MKNKSYTLEEACSSRFYKTKEYSDHKVYTLLNELSHFYYFIKFNVLGNDKAAFCVKNYGDIDSIMFGSIEGTINSIIALLDIGNINDAFALVRKYEDAIITNIYVDLLLDQEHEKALDGILGNEKIDIAKIFDNEVNKWVNSRHELPRKIKQKIAKFDKVAKLNLMFNMKGQTANVSIDLTNFTLRKTGNDNVH